MFVVLQSGTYLLRCKSVGSNPMILVDVFQCTAFVFVLISWVRCELLVKFIRGTLGSHFTHLG